ncbi:hypothetical protein EVAR_4225_1 [Eumeta japonica]|uniref:Uncharacterized protein n=1 Tax=Eumeta variegata TaxID=151549 RepID=A0A4C1TGZ5_EUMVA|nr:hypothetical protein EVAR_4225_1 [Eumeta japonica]
MTDGGPHCLELRPRAPNSRGTEICPPPESRKGRKSKRYRSFGGGTKGQKDITISRRNSEWDRQHLEDSEFAYRCALAQRLCSVSHEEVGKKKDLWPFVMMRLGEQPDQSELKWYRIET